MWGSISKAYLQKIQIPWIWNSLLWMSWGLVISPLKETTELLRLQISHQQENSIHIKHPLSKDSNIQINSKWNCEFLVWIGWEGKAKLSSSGWDMNCSCLRFILLFNLMMGKKKSDQTRNLSEYFCFEVTNPNSKEDKKQSHIPFIPCPNPCRPPGPHDCTQEPYRHIPCLFVSSIK